MGLGGSGSAAKIKSRSSPHWERRLLKPGQQTVRRDSTSESSPIPVIAHVQPDTSVYNYLYIRPQSLSPYLYFSSIRNNGWKLSQMFCPPSRPGSTGRDPLGHLGPKLKLPNTIITLTQPESRHCQRTPIRAMIPQGQETGSCPFPLVA